MGKNILYIFVSMIMCYLLFSFVAWDICWVSKMGEKDPILRTLWLATYCCFCTILWNAISLIEMEIKKK